MIDRTRRDHRQELLDSITDITQWIRPRRLGKYHPTAASAKKSRATTLFLMALPLLAVRVYAATRSLLEAGSLLEVKSSKL
jgi:hypothetical protein